MALDVKPEPGVDAVRDMLDEYVASGDLDYETCEARIEGSFDDLPEEDDDG